jgi:tRNA1(Val) A37 N6-methylase TrmN6
MMDTQQIPVTDDFFLGDRLRIRQPAKGYRAGIDAVLLAATAEAGGRILDVGAGCGVVGLCVAARLPDANVVLVERERALCALARQNVVANAMAAHVSVVEADITAALTNETRAILVDASFTHVLANPPFHDSAGGTAAASELKAASHAMPAGTLDEWLRFMARVAAPGGRATIIHKADALPDILDVFRGRFGAITVRPIHPRPGDAAIRVLVDGIKGSRAPLTLRPGLILHGNGHAFTDELNAILRHGAALEP